jgi:hypothetical protein
MSLKIVSDYKENIPSKEDLTRTVVKQSVIEWGVGFAIIACTVPFIAGSVIPLVITTVAICAINTALRSWEAHDKLFTYHRPANLKIQKDIEWGNQWGRALGFSILDSNRDTLVHEVGHYTAFKTLTKGIGNPKITISPFKGGSTFMRHRGLSALGSRLGERTSYGIIVGAGTLFSLVTSIIFIAIAHFKQNTCPELSRYLNASAMTSIVSSAIYALSALVMSAPGHDFAMLAALGIISPLAAVVAIIAIPVLLKCALLYFAKQKEMNSKVGTF